MIGTMTNADLFTGSYLHARCSIAKSLRTFRFDRIESISHPGTGELLDLASWAGSLQLGEAKPWGGGEVDEEAELSSPVPSTGTRMQIAKAVALAVAAGYALGRWRLIRWGLKLLGIKTGLWL